ncbi:MAG: alcohol dehydrogenase catalytic domain-containing protein [Candidatus Methanomethylicaceae archaeon]
MIKAAVLTSPFRISLQEFEIPKIKANEALLKPLAVGICGTDVAAYQGKFIKWKLPLIMGHEIIGEILEIGNEASDIYDINEGDRVIVEPYISCGVCEYCSSGYYQLCKKQRSYGGISCSIPPYLWGGYSECMYIAPGSHLHKVPSGVDIISGAMSNVMSNAIRWVVTKGHVSLCDTIVILGPGVQGLLSVVVAKEVGAEKVILAGLSEDYKRLELGKELGADFIINVDEEDIVKSVYEITQGKMADVVIVCAPSISAIESAFKLVKRLGRIVIISNTEGRQAKFVPDDIVWNEIEIYGGLGQSRVDLAIKLIQKYQTKIKKIITNVFELSNIKEAFEVATKKRDVIKVVIKI